MEFSPYTRNINFGIIAFLPPLCNPPGGIVFSGQLRCPENSDMHLRCVKQLRCEILLRKVKLPRCGSFKFCRCLISWAEYSIILLYFQEMGCSREKASVCNKEKTSPGHPGGRPLGGTDHERCSSDQCHHRDSEIPKQAEHTKLNKRSQYRANSTILGSLFVILSLPQRAHCVCYRTEVCQFVKLFKHFIKKRLCSC